MTITKTKPMTWERLIGLCQTDGHFGIMIKSDGSLKPVVIITITGKRPDLIQSVVDFYKKNKFSPQVTQYKEFERGYNITIELPTACKKFIENVERVIRSSEKIGFVGRKGVDYQLFKQALELQKFRKRGPVVDNDEQKRRNELLKNILIHKELLQLNRGSNEKLTREQLCQRLKIDAFPDVLDNNHPFMKEAERKAEEVFKDVFNVCLAFKDKPVEKIPVGILDYLAGVVEGDGSFQVNTETHEDAFGNAQRRRDNSARRLIDFAPMITITDKKDLVADLNNVYILANLLINQPDVSSVEEAKPYLAKPKESASRLVIKDKTVLAQRSVALFKRAGFASAYYQGRFNFFVDALSLLPIKSYDEGVLFVNKLFNNDFFDPNNRKVTKEKILELLKKQFQVVD